MFFALALAIGMCPLAPASAIAEPGGTADYNLTVSPNGGLTGQANGDYNVGTWGDLQSAINSAAEGQTIVLTADVTASPDDAVAVTM